MKQVGYFVLFVFVLLLCCIPVAHGQDQFYKAYNTFDKVTGGPQVILTVGERGYIWGFTVDGDGPAVYVIIVDKDGNRIGGAEFENAVMFERTVLYDEQKERFVVAVQHREGSFIGERILEVDLEGTLTNSVMYEFYDPSARWEDPYSIVKYKDGYAVAGMVYYGQQDLFALGGLTFLNNDYTVRSSSVTESEYHIIENLMITEQGELWGLVTNYCLSGQGTMGDCYQRLARFTDEGSIDTTLQIYDEEESKDDETEMVYSEEMQAFVYYYEHGGTRLPAIAAIDRYGATMWETLYSNIGMADYWYDIELASNGDILLLGSAVDVDDAYTSYNAFPTHARVDAATGQFEHRKYYIEYLDENRNRYQLPSAMKEGDDGYVYILIFSPLFPGEVDYTTRLLKVDSLGKVDTEQLARRQVLSELDPLPEGIVSSRNVWHIYNGDTDEHYRYTFADTVWRSPTSEIALRPLVKSDQMIGEQWYEFGSYWWGNDHQSFVGRIGQENGVTYRFNLEKGDEYLFDYISQDSFHFARHVVLDVDSMQLLDGRTKKVFTLRCKTDPEGTTYGTHTWIEDVGDIDHFSTAYQVCSEVKSEQIVCFYSAGQLLYTNPAFETCIVTTAEPLVAAPVGRLAPNPASEHIAMDVELSAYQIYSVAGQLVQEARASSDAIGLISVRTLAAGVYVVRGTTTAGQPITAKFVKL